jgi:Pyridoxamine 5'-phosphate oxidase
VTLCSQRKIHERDRSFISLPRAAAQIEEVMSMTSKEATIILRTNPVAQELLRSTIPARLAYVWRDGTPRVVPMWFHWSGEEFLMGAPPNAPKMKVLADHPSVALTIDGNDWPYPVLSVRGTSYVELVGQPVEQTFPEYAAMARRYLGDEGAQEFQTQARQTFARWTRIAIRPEEVRILDFKQRFPSAWSVG